MTAADVTARGVLLDVTRTISRAGLGIQTGIDRVEAAWISAALDGRWGDAWFTARIASGTYTIDASAMGDLTHALMAGGDLPPLDLRGAVSLRKRLAARRAESGLRRAAQMAPDGLIYLNVGHSNLTPESITAHPAGAVVLLHDVIPLDHPEFARASGPARARMRLEAAQAARAIVYNTADTKMRCERHMTAPPPGVVAPLGIDVLPVTVSEHDGFVVLGTIEPRKNHDLLLDVWAQLGPAAPPLHIVGRRGWMNEDVFARLDAHPAGVIEHGALDDMAAMELLKGARALLFPSFAEGYGLPLAEALALGVPVVASDLPALREVGGNVPVWCDPHDRAAWREAIMRLMHDDYRAARIAAASPWQPPTWKRHFAIVDDLIRGFA